MNPVQFCIMILLSGLGWKSPVQDNRQAACTDCHKALIEHKVVHPVADGCDNCHVANGKAHPQTGVKGFGLADKLPSLCYTCHDKIQTDIQKSLHQHAAVFTKQSCTGCHSPHSSSQGKLLIADGKQLCLNCHNKTIVTDSSKTENIKLMLDKAKVIHGAIEMDGCITCHSPHASANTALLKDAFPQGNYAAGKPENFALCFSCHEKKMITEANTKTLTQFRNGDKNLHYLHVNGAKGRNCTTCHNVHASANLHLINDYCQFGNWDMPIRFKEVEGGGACYPGCHAEKKYLR